MAAKFPLSEVSSESFYHEVRMHEAIPPHNNVIKMVGVCIQPMALVLEFYPHSLRNYMDDKAKNNRRSTSSLEHLELVLRVAIDVSAGLIILHSAGVIHRDIAGRNTYLRGDLSACIADFGLAVQMKKGSKTYVQTSKEREKDDLPVYTSAPESLSEGEFSPKSDVFMFAKFLWELFNGRQASNNDDRKYYTEHLLAGKRPPIPKTGWPL